MTPSWSQLWRRIARWWRLRKVAYTVCRECGFPFLMNSEGRDTANLERVEINVKDGSALCGECAPAARALREKIERKKARRRLRDMETDTRNVFMMAIPDGGYEAQPGVPIRMQSRQRFFEDRTPRPLS